MKLLAFAITWCMLLTHFTGPTFAAGFAHNENFTVFTPAEPSQEEGQALAQKVLLAAEQYRREIALNVLQEELPPSVGRTIINISFSEGKDSGLTWAMDHADRRYHNVYLTTSPQLALGNTLAHEIVHVVLATRFSHPRRLPPWVEEGIAGQYDDSDRVATRERIVRWFTNSGNWPRLAVVLDSASIDASDQATYATATSITNYLLSKADTDTLLQFARSGQESGWDAAVKQYYGIATVSELQTAWQKWAGKQLGRTATVPTTGTGRR